MADWRGRVTYSELWETGRYAYLEQTLAILRTPGANDLETGDRAVPCGVIVRVLSGDTGCGSVGTSENDGAGNVSARHVVGLASRVDNLVNGLHGEVEGHELATGGCDA
jgi:hypothetical protein